LGVNWLAIEKLAIFTMSFAEALVQRPIFRATERGKKLDGSVKGGYGGWLLARDARDDAQVWS